MFVQLIRKMKAAFVVRTAKAAEQVGPAREAQPPTHGEIIAAKRRRAKARRKQREAV